MEATKKYLLTTGKRARSFVETELLKVTKFKLIDGDATSANWVQDYALVDVELPEPMPRAVHFHPIDFLKKAIHQFTSNETTNNGF